MSQLILIQILNKILSNLLIRKITEIINLIKNINNFLIWLFIYLFSSNCVNNYK